MWILAAQFQLSTEAAGLQSCNKSKRGTCVRQWQWVFNCNEDPRTPEMAKPMRYLWNKAVSMKWFIDKRSLTFLLFVFSFADDYMYYYLLWSFIYLFLIFFCFTYHTLFPLLYFVLLTLYLPPTPLLIHSSERVKSPTKVKKVWHIKLRQDKVPPSFTKAEQGIPP